MKKRTKSRTTRFLKIGFAAVLIICILIFSCLVIFMSRQSSEGIMQAGTFYMKGLSEQIAAHFDTMVELRLGQVQSMIESIETDDSADSERLYSQISHSARVLGFKYLALLSESGNIEMIYGKKIEIVNPDSFLESMNTGGIKAAVGTDEKGENVVIVGASCNYPMRSDDKCTALIAALPVDYITETLDLDIDGNKVYSFIIRQDGSYVVRTEKTTRNNYFDRVHDIYEPVKAKTPDDYLDELKSAMGREEPYSCQISAMGERQQVYCMKLDHSDWYLITFMHYGVLNQTINKLSVSWLIVASACCVVILLVFLSIFMVYYNMMKKQLEEVEKARFAAEKANKAKSEFLSNISHDIRTPMNAIVGMTSIAISNIEKPGQVEDCLKKITMSGKQLLGIINNVLDMSKIESGKMTLNLYQSSLRDIMDSNISVIQPQISVKNQKFDVFIHDITAENVYCDSVRLNQVIMNILANAVKFTPEGGRIRVELYEEPSDKGESYVRVHFIVKDSGIGMSEQFLKNVFDSFSREDSARVNKIEGTGLGLAITKYIVDAMGGTIEADSEQNVGSEFRVTLDFEKAEESEEEMRLPDWNILVVDDDQRICEDTAKLLETMGANAEWVLDGKSAIEHIINRHEADDDYDIVLLDWRLPIMDGITTANEINRLLGSELPIILVSAYDWDDIKKAAGSVGITDFISKPLFKSTLYCALKKYAPSERELGQEDACVRVFDGKRILLAEDNELNWEIANELLREVGFEIEWARNGKECLEKFSACAVGKYDAVIMDIRMPIMNGYEAATAIRKLDREDAGKIPIIAMTADAFAEDVKKCMDCGMNAHIAKPINIREVVRVMEKVLHDQ